MKITLSKEVDLTEEQQEIYDKGFDDGVSSVKEHPSSRILLTIFCIGLICTLVIQVLNYINK